MTTNFNIQFAVYNKSIPMTKEAISNLFSQISSAIPKHTHLIPSKLKSKPFYVLNVNVNQHNLELLLDDIYNGVFTYKELIFMPTPEFKNRSTVVYQGDKNTIQQIFKAKIAYQSSRLHFIGHDGIAFKGHCAFIVLKNPLQALQIANEGFYAGNEFIPHTQLSLYNNVHIIQCYRCYTWNDHLTRYCK